MKPLRLWLGSVLVALGILWLLDAAGLLAAGQLIGRWWPAALIALGVLAAIGERRLAPGPMLLVLVGTAFLIDQLGIVRLGAMIWPFAAIVVGCWMLVEYALHRKAGRHASDRGNVFALLGGSHAVNRSNRFEHADVSAVLGGATLDLREATLAPGAQVDALALFGGIEVIVPQGWRVEVSGLPIFGGYQDKTRGQRGLSPDVPG